MLSPISRRWVALAQAWQGLFHEDSFIFFLGTGRNWEAGSFSFNSIVMTAMMNHLKLWVKSLFVSRTLMTSCVPNRTGNPWSRKQNWKQKRAKYNIAKEDKITWNQLCSWNWTFTMSYQLFSRRALEKSPATHRSGLKRRLHYLARLMVLALALFLHRTLTKWSVYTIQDINGLQ